MSIPRPGSRLVERVLSWVCESSRWARLATHVGDVESVLCTNNSSIEKDFDEASHAVRLRVDHRGKRGSRQLRNLLLLLLFLRMGNHLPGSSSIDMLSSGRLAVVLVVLILGSSANCAGCVSHR
jgi:hypothetical protein